LCGVRAITAFVFSCVTDGDTARLSGQASQGGALLDATLDRVGDAAVYGGLVIYYTTSGAEATLGTPEIYMCLALACLVCGNITSYARARAESLGFQAQGGIAERSDRLVSILVMTGFNGL